MAGRLRSMPSAEPHDEDDVAAMASLPEDFDWRNVNNTNYVTPVVNQVTTLLILLIQKYYLDHELTSKHLLCNFYHY